MTFRTRLITGHFVLLLLIAGTALAAILGLHLSTSRSERIARAMTAELVAVEHLRFQAEQVVAISRGYLLTGDQETYERFETTYAQLETSIRNLRLDPVGEMLADMAGTSAKRYAAAASEAARRRAAYDDPSSVLDFFDTTVMPRRLEFETRVGALADLQHARFATLLERAQAFAVRTEVALLAASAIAIGIGVTLAILTIRALTAQYRRVEDAQAAAQAAAAARDEILAVVSHDLRNPLNSIALASTLLEDSVGDGGKAHLRVVHNATGRMLHLIEHLLETDALDAGRVTLRRERCVVQDLLDAVAELFRTRAAEREIELRIEPHATSVVGDRERLIEVLSNLVGNALDHTPRGGAITLRATVRDRDVQFEVVDTGPGVPPEQQAHLFDRYWRGPKRAVKSGFGLGLYICKRLVEAHAGTIGVNSGPGSGASFWFRVPNMQ